MIFAEVQYRSPAFSEVHVGVQIWWIEEAGFTSYIILLLSYSIVFSITEYNHSAMLML